MQIPAKEFVYAHSYASKLVADTKTNYLDISKMKLDEKMSMQVVENDLYINTWIGAKSARYFPLIKKYGWLLSNHTMFYELIKNLNEQGIKCEQLSKPEDYIPTINYKFYQIEEINKFVKTNQIKVLICNGKVGVRWAEFFDFDDLIERLSKHYNNLLFFHTAPSAIKRDNLIYTTDFIMANNGDLNEISYLSTFCKIIIGRGSGPFCFSEVKANYFDPQKRFIGIPGAFKSDGAKGVFLHHYSKTMFYDNSYNVMPLFEKALSDILSSVGVSYPRLITPGQHARSATFL